jgi:D-alanyl-D-alanine carboxypeptidase
MLRLTRILLVAVLFVSGIGRLRADDLDEFVTGVIRERHIPAVSLAVVKDGRLVRSAGYGVADLEHGVGAVPETVYKLGSVSKQFIAAGIMLLVQDRKLALTDTVGTFLPDAPASWGGISVRHLLTHTSGLVRESPGFQPYTATPDIDVIRAAFTRPLDFKTGDEYRYSNLGYYTLAEIVTRVSGKPWPAFLHERIFSPLGMADTQPTTVADLVPRRARGYVWSDRFTNAEDWTAVRPSAAFLSTVLDMAKWEVALQTDRILTPASKQQMWTRVRLNDGSEYPYGFAWELDDFPPGGFSTGVAMIRHEGSIPGFRAAYGRLPKQSLAVVVLSNLEGAALDSIVAGVAVHYAPDLLPAARQRWEPQALGLK